MHEDTRTIKATSFSVGWKQLQVFCLSVIMVGRVVPRPSEGFPLSLKEREKFVVPVPRTHSPILFFEAQECREKYPNLESSMTNFI
jgi:hypothetical protein